jgi:hypothetical protein
VEAIEEDRDGKDKVDRLHTVAVFGWESLGEKVTVALFVFIW